MDWSEELLLLAETSGKLTVSEEGTLNPVWDAITSVKDNFEAWCFERLPCLRSRTWRVRLITCRSVGNRRVRPSNLCRKGPLVKTEGAQLAQKTLGVNWGKSAAQVEPIVGPRGYYQLSARAFFSTLIALSVLDHLLEHWT